MNLANGCAHPANGEAKADVGGQELRAGPAAGSQPATSPATADFPEVLDVEDLGRYLRVSGRTIGRMRAAGKLLPPTLSFSFGKKRERAELRWSLLEVRAWLAAGCPDAATWSEVRRIEATRRRRRQRRGE